ncbi:hypothetical protein D4A92_19855 [Rhizobium rosettiformans]|uniref:Uncharacterized protein n=1 Tax=Rhizobium rosettiformans TaxID=1368430 RepID=A0ABX7EZM6_9HYPH|nr:hypothetical protein [Rhizobium rosettiformans]QRF53542.1 hypothetical protein D4A92_19855 [Rhizobium rosettiformans]
MTSPFASDLIRNVIQAFRPHRETGMILAPKAVDTLIRNLRTIEELAREYEQELVIQMELRKLSFTPSELRPRLATDRVDTQIGGNVYRLPTRIRVIEHGPDGGDAA